MQADPNYSPGQTWWDKLWGTINSWWQSIPAWEKALAGTILVVVSIGVAVATYGASLGPQAALLGGASTALASAAKVALIEVSLGIGFAAVGWVISSAMTGQWNVGSLENAVADAMFFGGVFLFLHTSISAMKYYSRLYNTPAVESNTLASYEIDPRSIEKAREGSQKWDAVRRRVWKAEAEFRPDVYGADNVKLMAKGRAPLDSLGKPIQLHHVVSKKVDMYNVIKVTQAQHIAIHQGITYYYNVMWTLENAIKYGGLV